MKFINGEWYYDRCSARAGLGLSSCAFSKACQRNPSLRKKVDGKLYLSSKYKNKTDNELQRLYYKALIISSGTWGLSLLLSKMTPYTQNEIYQYFRYFKFSNDEKNKRIKKALKIIIKRNTLKNVP